MRSTTLMTFLTMALKSSNFQYRPRRCPCGPRPGAGDSRPRCSPPCASRRSPAAACASRCRIANAQEYLLVDQLDHVPDLHLHAVAVDLLLVHADQLGDAVALVGQDDERDEGDAHQPRDQRPVERGVLHDLLTRRTFENSKSVVVHW